MAQLTAADRRALPASDFGEPSTRAYPMPDRAHAANAKARAAQHASPAARAKIDAKANRILGTSKHSGAGTHTPPRRHAPMPHGFTRGPQHHN
jgi:hypothetical protein